MLLHAAWPAVLVILTVGGCALASVFLASSAVQPVKVSKKKGKPPAPETNKPRTIALSVLWVIMGITFASSVAWPAQIDPNDDWIAYLMYPEKILQTGTFLDPFSLRRVTALGGQSFLQALVMVVGAPENGHILDRGIGCLLLFGCMLGMLKPLKGASWWMGFAVIAIAISSAVPRIHTGSHMLGLALLFALVCQIARYGSGPLPWRVLLPSALLLAAVASLRPMFAMVGATTLIVYHLSLAVRENGAARLTPVFALIKTGLLTVALLLPYMVLSFLSSGTPMFPLANGYANPAMIFGGTKEGGMADVFGALRFLTMPEIGLMLAALLAALWLSSKDFWLGIASALAGAGILILSCLKMGAASPYDVYRYVYPLAGFALLWCLLAACRSPREIFGIPALAAVGVGLLAFTVPQWKHMITEFPARITTLPLQLRGFQFPVARFAPDYQQLQTKVPPGEKVFTVVDAPYLLDFARNTVDNVDSIGGASPPPGMPFGKGPEALKSYLADLGYTYAIVVDFDSAVLLYTRKLWENHPRPEWYFKEVWGKYALDFMANMDSISDWNTVARSGNCRLIKLR